MLTILAPILVFGLVVFVHELGHFLAAKWVGVYAPRFSIGFGPALYKRRRGETEYVIAALPLGGYVRMASREDEATAFLEGGSEMPAATVPVVSANDTPVVLGGTPERGKDWDPEAMMPFGPKPVPEHRWFESKGLAARVFIMSAGVLMNWLLAFVTLMLIVIVYGVPRVPAVVREVMPESPAARAGLAPGDSIVAVDGERVASFTDVAARISAAPGRTFTLQVARAGAVRDVTVRADTASAPDRITGKPRVIGRIGVAPTETIVRERPGAGRVFVYAWNATWNMGSDVVATLKGLINRDVSVKQLGGPIAIARTSVAAARGGLEPLFTLIAFLSINVAILNLLPIPVLDGGQILLNVAEAVKGGTFSARTREYVLRVGLAAILLLFVTVMWNDILRLFTGGAQ